MQRIDFEIYDLPEQKILASALGRNYFEYDDDSLVWSYDYWTNKPHDEDDPKRGTEEVNEIGYSRYKREVCIGVTRAYNQEVDKWEVVVKLSTNQEDPYFFVDTEQKAEDIFNELEKWVFAKKRKSWMFWKQH